MVFAIPAQMSFVSLTLEKRCCDDERHIDGYFLTTLKSRQRRKDCVN